MRQEETPHTLYLRVKAETGDPVAALRAIRAQYALELAAAKEIGVQADGIASSLDEHQERLAPTVLQALEDSHGPPDAGSRHSTRTDVD